MVRSTAYLKNVRSRSPVVALMLAVLLTSLLTSCGSGTVVGVAGHTGQQVWLCRPGSSHDPCVAPDNVTSVPSQGAMTIQSFANAGSSSFDCFFLYPTVSTQHTMNSSLIIEPPETDVAFNDAAPFSHVCRVWAPMYRQRTVFSLEHGLGADRFANEVAYQSVLVAWRYYLAHFNHGRPVILLGVSQGAAMLIRLLADQFDHSAALRRSLVSAIVLGGNVTVAPGQLLGGSFTHVPLCADAARASCVIAYSSFPAIPPWDAQFGVPGQGVSWLSGQTATSGVEVACVNPVARTRVGAVAPLRSQFIAGSNQTPHRAVHTVWVRFPGLYSAQCRRDGARGWLQVTTNAVRGDQRPKLSEFLGSTWGYHADDLAVALGNLVSDVALQEHAYEAHRR